MRMETIAAGRPWVEHVMQWPRDDSATFPEMITMTRRDATSGEDVIKSVLRVSSVQSLAPDWQQRREALTSGFLDVPAFHAYGPRSGKVVSFVELKRRQDAERTHRGIDAATSTDGSAVPLSRRAGTWVLAGLGLAAAVVAFATRGRGKRAT